MKLCKEAYQKLIDEDIEWLLKQPRDVETDHIEAVLKKSVDLLYGKDDFDKIELFDTISEEYAINFPDDVFNGIVSVKGLITYIKNEIRK